MEDHSQQEDLNDILLKLGHYIGSQDFATGKAYLETQVQLYIYIYIGYNFKIAGE